MVNPVWTGLMPYISAKPCSSGEAMFVTAKEIIKTKTKIVRRRPTIPHTSNQAMQSTAECMSFIKAADFSSFAGSDGNSNVNALITSRATSAVLFVVLMWCINNSPSIYSSALASRKIKLSRCSRSTVMDVPSNSKPLPVGRSS